MEIYRRLQQGFGAGRRVESFFQLLHPTVLFLYFVTVFVCQLLYRHPLFALTGFFGAVLLARLYGAAAMRRRALRAAGLMGLFIALLNPLVSHRGTVILGYLFDRPLTLEAICFGLLSAISLMGLLLLFVSFNACMDSARFLYLFGRIAPRLAFVTNLSLRYMDVLSMRARELKNAHHLRGVRPDAGRLLARLRASGRLLDALVALSLEEGMLLAESLKAKDYGKYKRTSFVRYRYTGLDVALLALLSLCLIGFAFAYAQGYGRYAPYPQLLAPSVDAPTLLCWGAMLLVCIVPLLLETWALWQRRRNRVCHTA